MDDEWSRTRELERLIGLQDTIASVRADEASGDEWRRARASALARLADWREDGDGVGRDDDAFLRLTRALSVRREIEAMWLSGDQLNAGVLDCVFAPHVRRSKEAYGAWLSRRLLASQQYGDPLSFSTLEARLLSVDRRYFTRPAGIALCGRLSGRREPVSRPAEWALLSNALECDAVVTPSEAAFVGQFDFDWAAVSQAAENYSTQSLGEELQLRVVREQFARSRNMKFSLRYPDAAQAFRDRMSSAMQSADHDNTARVRELLSQREWFDDALDGAGAQRSAWLIIQHADAVPEFQREMLTRLARFVGTDRLRSADYAMLWDRVAMHDGRPQRFGTQMGCENGEIVAVGGVEAPAELDQRRQEFGLQPWSEYQAINARLSAPCVN